MNHEQAHFQAHERAIENLTAERYLLDELSEAECDAFEEHYFDCVVCAETVRAGVTMFASGQKLVDEPVVVPFPKPRPWSALWSQAAAAGFALAFAANILMSFQPSIEPVRLVNISTDARGPNETVYHLSKGEQLALSVDVPPGFPYSNYQIGVRTAKGKTIDTVTISAETAKNPKLLLLRKLPAGSYVLVIEGVRADGNRVPVTSSRFIVQR
jgi:hypothetical protein